MYIYHLFFLFNFTGVLSVFGQHIDYLSNALRVLDLSSDNQYGIRGQPRFDKVEADASSQYYANFVPRVDFSKVSHNILEDNMQ